MMFVNLTAMRFPDLGMGCKHVGGDLVPPRRPIDRPPAPSQISLPDSASHLGFTLYSASNELADKSTSRSVFQAVRYLVDLRNDDEGDDQCDDNQEGS